MDFSRVFELIRSKRHFFTQRSDFKVEEKSRANYVTSIDQTIQQEIRTGLEQLFPSIDFVGEEASKHTTSKLFWLLDPIDGTQNFIKGQYPSMISLALVERGQVVFALIYDPYFDQMYHALLGKGAYQEDQRLSVSTTKVENAIVMVGTSPYSRHLSLNTFNLAKNIFEKANDIRRSGSACYDLVQVATGQADGYVELFVHSWDYAAGLLLINEAGGQVSDNKGNSISNIRVGTTSIVASNKIIHQDLIVLSKEAI